MTLSEIAHQVIARQLCRKGVQLVSSTPAEGPRRDDREEDEHEYASDGENADGQRLVLEE